MATWPPAVSFQCDLTVKYERHYTITTSNYAVIYFGFLWPGPATGLAVSQFGLAERHVKEQGRSHTGYKNSCPPDTHFGGFGKEPSADWHTAPTAAADRRPPGPCPWCLSNGPARSAHTAPRSRGTAPHSGNGPQSVPGPPRRKGRAAAWQHETCRDRRGFYTFTVSTFSINSNAAFWSLPAAALGTGPAGIFVWTQWLMALAHWKFVTFFSHSDTCLTATQ